MSHAYTPTATWHSTATMPDDADNGTAAAQNVPDEAALDNAQYLRSALPVALINVLTHYDDSDSLLATSSLNVWNFLDAAVAVLLTGIHVTAGDICEAVIQFHSIIETTSSRQEVRLEVSYDAGANWTPVQCRALRYAITGDTSRHQLVIVAQWTAGSTATDARLRLCQKSPDSVAVDIYAPIVCNFRSYRVIP